MTTQFPNNPVNGQVFEATSAITYTYISAKKYWLSGNKNIPLELIENNFDAGINAVIFSGLWDLDYENDIHTFLLMGV